MDLLVGENPTAALFSEVASVLRDVLKISAVLTHNSVPAVLKAEAQARLAEEGEVATEGVARGFESRRPLLDLRKIEAERPVFGRPRWLQPSWVS